MPNLNIEITEELRTAIRIQCMRDGEQVKEWVPRVLGELLRDGTVSIVRAREYEPRS